MVNKAKKYIKLGDIFQVVLSQRFETNLNKKPLDIYKKLRITNPSPFMFYFNFNASSYNSFASLSLTPAKIINIASAP